MRTKFTAFLIVVLFLCLTGSARAGQLIGSLSPITTNPTNSAIFLTNTATISLPQITVQNNALSMTNAFVGSFRWSFDGVNFYTNSSPQFSPPGTNATSTTVVAQIITVPIYIEMQSTTNVANTTTINLGVTSP